MFQTIYSIHFLCGVEYCYFPTKRIKLFYLSIEEIKYPTRKKKLFSYLPGKCYLCKRKEILLKQGRIPRLREGEISFFFFYDFQLHFD